MKIELGQKVCVITKLADLGVSTKHTGTIEPPPDHFDAVTLWTVRTKTPIHIPRRPYKPDYPFSLKTDKGRCPVYSTKLDAWHDMYPTWYCQSCGKVIPKDEGWIHCDGMSSQEVSSSRVGSYRHQRTRDRARRNIDPSKYRKFPTLYPHARM